MSDGLFAAVWMIAVILIVPASLAAVHIALVMLR